MSSKKLDRASRYAVEALEPRTYFVVLHAGDVFEFWAENARYERVVVTGDTGTVELFGIHINTTSGQESLNSMQGVITAGPDFTPTPGVEFGNQINGGMPPNAQTAGGGGSTGGSSNAPVFADNIYAMFVSQADATTHIAVAEVPNLTPMPTPRNMEPYAGSVTLRVQIVNNGLNPPVVTAGNGSALLGGRTPTLMGNNGGGQGSENIPILTPFPAPADSVTVLPGTTITPGLTVAQGQNLGEFLWGGAIEGTVNIHGSVNLFYAGWIVTGNALGDAVGQVSSPDNFNVDGDIRYLITSGPIGSSGNPNTLGNPDVPNYESGFDMRVGGKLGAIQTSSDIFGNVNVINSPTAPSLSGLPFTQLANNTIANSWNNADFGGDAATNNDTFTTPQYLGTIDPQGDVIVNGAIQSFATTNDHSANYYGVALMAGQTIGVQLTQPPQSTLFTDGYNFGFGAGGPGSVEAGGFANLPVTTISTGIQLSVGVFDPDGRLIATDYSRTDPSQLSLQPFQFTATMPGVYRIAVAGSFYNNTFAATTGRFIGEDLYTIQLAHVGNLAAGAIAAAGNVIDNLNLAQIITIGAGGQLIITGGSGNNTTQGGFRAQNGDLGAIVAGGEVLGSAEDIGPGSLAVVNGAINSFSTANGSWTILVDNGNLRAVSAASIGLATGPTSMNAAGQQAGAAFGDIPETSVPNGSIGLLQATSKGNATGNGATGILAWNDFVGAAGVELTTAESTAVGIGGDFQYVEAANILYGDFVAKGNIGSVVVEGNMATDPPSYFQVNAANNLNVHAVIDSIDCAGSFGLLGPGGPGITTGPGGNLRYLHVGTDPWTTAGEDFPGDFPTAGLVFRDAFFGGGIIEQTYNQAGQTATITDDSGAVVHISPQDATDSIGVLTYPVRGSGGAAIVQIEVANLTSFGTGAANSFLNSGGVNITTSSGSAEIGNIVIDGAGRVTTVPTTGRFITLTSPQIFGTGTTPTAGGAPAAKGSNGKFILPVLPAAPALATTGTPININISGPGKADVYMISSSPGGADGSLAANAGHISAITDTSGGEILNMHVNSIGTLTTNGTLGIAAEHNTPAAVIGLIRTPLQEDKSPGEPWNYPFVLPTTMVRILGDVGSISAVGGIGNLYAGIISSGTNEPFATTVPAALNAIPAGNPISSRTDGAIGSLTGPILGPVVTAGVINTVLAKGIGWNGDGAVGFAGIFSANLIGNVTVTGVDRGAIVSAGAAAFTTLADITALPGILSLTVNGILDQAEVADFARFDFAEPRASAVNPAGSISSSLNFPLVTDGLIQVTGNGGIIGTDFEMNDFTGISASNSGFGIFDSRIVIGFGDSVVGPVTAGGYGIRDGFIEGGATISGVRANGNGSNLPVTDFPSIVRQGESGAVFDPVTGLPISFLNDISSYLGTTATVHQIAGVTDSGVIENLTVEGSRQVNNITAWSIRGRNLATTTAVGAFTEVVGVGVSEFNIADVIGQLNVAGPINGATITTGRTTKFNFGGDVANFNLTVAGPIGNLVFNSSLLGSSVIAAQGPSGKIQSITIHGNFSGQIMATRNIGAINILGTMIGTIKAASIGTIKLTGGIGAGTLAVSGNVGTFQTTGDLSSPGTLSFAGSVKTIKVGHNLHANITVANNLGTLLVAASILSGSSVNVTNTLNLLDVGQDVQAGATITAHIIKKKVIGGQLLGTITTA